ncbi:S-layer homology domain-containing protein [Dysosmobacter sp.]|uniref:S-layer homology domain-containing protein n=1 Tax=Dysosmobacter sp. TaxID=2591382 RepID=UPI003FD73AD9
MKKRVSAILLALVLVFGLLPATVFAAGGMGTAVYVRSDGNDTTGDGSADKPYATLAKAVDAANDGATVYVMSDLTMTECARFYSKSLTITSLGDATYTITRGDNFAQQQDNARSTYNPAMVEVQTTSDVGAGLTLTNIIFDDGGKKEGTVFAQAVSDDSTGTADTSHNTDYVQDAIIASNATVPSTITLGAGAVLRNFGGMSAVRATGEAKLVMEPGSVIEDDSAVITTRGSDADETNAAKGPAGAVWLQGSDFEMKSGAEIKNVNGRAVYADGGEVTIGGTISGITGNANMWQATKKDGTSGTAIHLRGENASAVLTSTSVVENISGGGSAVYVTGKGNKVTTERGATIRSLTNTTGIYCTFASEAQLNGEITGLTESNALNLNEDTKVVLDADGSIHDNACATAVVYLRAGAEFTIRGKINNNTSTDKCAALYIVTNGNSSHATLEPGGEICSNTNGGSKYGAAVELQQGSCSFTMNGGTISGNSGPCGAVQVHKDSAKFIMNSGEVTGNTSTTGGEAGIYVEAKTPTVELNAGKAQSVTLAANVSASPSKGHIYISDRFDLESGLVDMVQDAKTVTPAADSLDIKLGNASADSVTALTDKAAANGWSTPLTSFWAQRDDTAALTVDGLMPTSSLPVYGLVQETGTDGKPTSGSAVRVYSTEITADGIRLTLPNGYANGCAVALAQPTTDFGSVVITTTKPELKETADLSGAYEVPYTVTYTMSDSLLSMLKTASVGIPAMSFVVELDSRLTAKTDDSGNCLYTFDGDGILGGTASVSGHTVTVTCAPLPGWKAAIAGKSSVKMVLQCTGVLAAADFTAGEYLNTSAHISGTVSDGSTVTPVMIPSNVCRTKMTAQTFTVTYRGNGADSGMTADATAYAPGETATVKANSYTCDGCTFTGWNTEPDGSGAPYKAGDQITMTDNVVLYAQWTRNSSGDGGDTGYTLRLTKLDAGNGTPLSGAKFELWRVGARSDTRLGVYETNRYGWTQAEVSQSGDYYWVETVPPEGYRLNGGKHPTNTSKNSRITVYNAEAAVPALFTDNHYAYIVGGPDGTVRPNDSMTRAGVATIFFRLLKDSVRDANLLTSNTYTDVPGGHWANTAIFTMTGLDIVRGYDAAAFGPGDPITRAQFAAICARFDTGKSNGSRTFSDIKGHWAKAYIERAAELGWISGFQDGTFRPDAYITRAQAVTMINRMLNRVPEDPSDLLPGMNVWPDCRPGDWFYLAIQEATNSHDHRHKADSYETWTSLNANPDWTRYEN